MVGNHCLARSIVDAAWAMLRGMIEDKAEWAGRRVIALPPHITSQWCSECGQIVQKALSVRTHVCPHCGYSDCRDTNAAKNILRLGREPSGRDCNSGLDDLRSTGLSCEHHKTRRQIKHLGIRETETANLSFGGRDKQ